jgi:CheY-like chemotaxis protein
VETLSDRGRPTILAVDDQLTSLELLVEILEPNGYEVRTAGTGSEAIASAVAQKLSAARSPAS